MCLFATPTEGPPSGNAPFAHTHRITHTETCGALSWCSNITDNLVGLLSWQRTFIVCHVAMALYRGAKRVSLYGLAQHLCACVCESANVLVHFWPFARPDTLASFYAKMSWGNVLGLLFFACLFSFFSYHYETLEWVFICSGVRVPVYVLSESVYNGANILGYWFRAAIS